MKRKLKIYLYVISILLLFSCDYKETHVINTIHKDGSVTRKVTVKTSTSKFLDFKEVDVPIDSSWQIETKMDVEKAKNVGEKNDTTWYLTAEKHFKSVDEINNDFINDNGANRALKRIANFTKSFRWFTTVFRYSETVEKILEVTCPLSDFLNEEELNFVYLPNKIQGALINGPDSIKYKLFADTIETKTETWFWTSEIRQWIEVFYDLYGDDPNLKISKGEMLSKEPQFAEYLMNGESRDNETESNNDSVIIVVLGEEFYSLFKNEIDSSISVVNEIDKPFWSYSDYDMEIRMPGKIIATNGFVETDTDNDGGKGILWTIKGECFLTQTYEMWVESRVNNYLMWIVTVVFVLFVIVGFVRFQKKKNLSKKIF